MLSAVVAEPMAYDSVCEFPLLGDRMNHKESAYAEGASRAREIMDVQAGDRRGDDVSATVQHRMVNERNEESRHVQGLIRAIRSGRRAKVRARA